MNDDYADLKERIERLERIVEELRARKATAAAPAARPASPVEHIAARRPVAEKTSIVSRPIKLSSDLRMWLRFIGIGLLLFGVVFLFKFSENEPTGMHILRVCIGVALGIGLALFGRGLLAQDRAFAQVLTGGGIGVWYISGFAAYQLFALVPDTPAFAYMALVTVLAFVISVRQDSVPLAIVATLGGLATPFLLHDPARGVLGVVLYVTLVTSGAVAICLRRRWKALLWVTAGASTLAIVSTVRQYIAVDSPESQRWIVEAGIVYWWITFAVVGAWSVVRILRRRGTTEHDNDLLLLVVLVPVGAILMTIESWNLQQEDVGNLCVATAIVYTGVTLRLFFIGTLRRLVSAHVVVASGLAATGMLLLLSGHPEHVAIAAEALLLRVLWRWARVGAASEVSHSLYFLLFFLLLTDMVTASRPTIPLLNTVGITTLWTIATAAAAALVLPRGQLRRFYLYAAHALVLLWILQQCSLLANGQAVVSVIWGVYGAGLVVAGLLTSNRSMRRTGFVTLLAVVAKMFMVDLASVRAIWRVLLFVGFGGVFLTLSYWFMSLDRSRSARPS